MLWNTIRIVSIIFFIVMAFIVISAVVALVFKIVFVVFLAAAALYLLQKTIHRS